MPTAHLPFGINAACAAYVACNILLFIAYRLLISMVNGWIGWFEGEGIERMQLAWARTWHFDGWMTLSAVVMAGLVVWEISGGNLVWFSGWALPLFFLLQIAGRYQHWCACATALRDDGFRALETETEP
jgi:cytochrome b561